MDSLFPGGQIEKTEFHDLNQPARLKKAALFINIGEKIQLSKNDDNLYVAGSRIDALSYGSVRENLARTFDMVVSTSWEEVIVYRYVGLEGLAQCVCDYLRWAPVEKSVAPPTINAFCFSSNYANSVAHRIEELFSSVIQAYYESAFSKERRYVMMIAKRYFIFEYNEGNLGYTEASSYRHLLKVLSSEQKKFSPVTFDHDANWDTPLPKLYNLNQAQTIQIFFAVENQTVHLYIIDELGSLFTQKMPFYDSQSLISHFSLFFNSTIERRNYLMEGKTSARQDIKVEFYLLDKDSDSSCKATYIEVKPEPYAKNYFNIQVIGNLDDEQKTTLTIFCDDKEFSSLEYGNELFSIVTNHILERRRNRESYPIYISDIDLSQSLLVENDTSHIQTIHFLNYKKRIEDKLNDALKGLT